jgi:DNA repair exonuclease SbcCD nuclease subunit
MLPRARFLAIGDPHFRQETLHLLDLYISRVLDVIREHNPDAVVILGDLLHTHERLHTTILNKAHDFVEAVSQVRPVHVLVGNHDYINNSQFLSSSHWMNGMKKWPNVRIVDEVVVTEINGVRAVMCPYVPPGRFREALGENITGADLVFCHQEFKGCKMGAIVSVEGDEWFDDDPYVISGHVHDKQRLAHNLYYAGSSLQHAYGESHDKTIALVDVRTEGAVEVSELSLAMPIKSIIYTTISELKEKGASTERRGPDDQVRYTITAPKAERKQFEKTKLYKEMVKRGDKVVFRDVDEGVKVCAPSAGEEKVASTTFQQTLWDALGGDPKLEAIYRRVIT